MPTLPPTSELIRRAEAVAPKVRLWREQLHRAPELSYQEVETAALVTSCLTALPGVAVSHPTATSVLGTLPGSGDRGVIAIRADLDALPIQEETALSFASARSGVMHACGHDGHTAILLGVAELLAGSSPMPVKEVRFIFQHAEEKAPGGARELVEAGVVDDVDAVVGIHLDNRMATGTVGLQAGPIMAGSDEFIIRVGGPGGHAAYPHLTRDTISAAATLVGSLSHIVARETDAQSSLVVSLGRFRAGDADNVVPEVAELAGTVRYFDSGLRDSTIPKLERAVAGIDFLYGTHSVLDYERGYAPVINDETAVSLVKAEIEAELGPITRTFVPHMGSEDFSAYLSRSPGVFMFVGAQVEGNEASWSHHHSHFAIDERSLLIGLKVVLASTLAMVRGRQSLSSAGEA